MKGIRRITLAIVFALVMNFVLHISTASAQVLDFKVGNGDVSGALLQQGDSAMIPKSAIEGNITVTSPGSSGQAVTNSFYYQEESWSKNRGITIKLNNSTRPSQTYKFDPNPHNDPWYNKNQPKFYRDAAQQIGEYFNRRGSFPRYGQASVTINGINYKLNQR
ncbi:hypothetical protein JYQ62_09070 [Nostoc sp. UHCC 0702]|nr:hypothetical protein JYQ62_09070 [Nostoc sp. UHCC 0702]